MPLRFSLLLCVSWVHRREGIDKADLVGLRPDLAPTKLGGLSAT